MSLKNKNFIFGVLIFFSLKCNDVFMPDMKPDLSNMPPFTSDLLKEEREKDRTSENQKIEQIVKKVVSGNDCDLQKQAEELAKDKTTAQKLFSAFSEDMEVSLPPKIKECLDATYKDSEFLNKNISIKLKQTDIREVVELIGKTVGINFIVDAGVKGITNNINLEKIPVSYALKLVLSSNRPRLALIKDLGVWRVLRLSDATVIIKNKIEEQERFDFINDFTTINNAKLTESLKLRVEKMWEGIISGKQSKEGYYLIFDESSRKVFFRGKKAEVEYFKIFLKEIDDIIPQVRIEARVVIASKDFEESFGLQISGVYNRSSSAHKKGWTYIGFGPVKTGGQGDIDPTNLTSWALNLLPTSANQFLNLPIIFGGNNLDTKRLNLVLNAAEEKSEINTILKPSLLVNSDESAEILVGEEIPIETVVQEQIEGSLRNIDTVNYKDLGIKLKVKPIVTPNKKSIFLDIYVENSYLKDVSSTSQYDSKKSIISTTKSKNRVLLKSGQTTLIGGLISNEQRRDKKGVPILQDIPVLGFLFSGTKRIKKDDQLMIFITPTVVC